MFQLLLWGTLVLAALTHPTENEEVFSIDGQQKNTDESTGRAFNEPDANQLLAFIEALGKQGNPNQRTVAPYSQPSRRFFYAPYNYPAYRQPYYSGPYKPAFYPSYNGSPYRSPYYQRVPVVVPSLNPSFDSYPQAVDNGQFSENLPYQDLAQLEAIKSQQVLPVEIDSSQRQLGSIPILTLIQEAGQTSGTLTVTPLSIIMAQISQFISLIVSNVSVTTLTETLSVTLPPLGLTTTITYNKPSVALG